MYWTVPVTNCSSCYEGGTSQRHRTLILIFIASLPSYKMEQAVKRMHVETNRPTAEVNRNHYPIKTRLFKLHWPFFYPLFDVYFHGSQKLVYEEAKPCFVPLRACVISWSQSNWKEQERSNAQLIQRLLHVLLSGLFFLLIPGGTV